MTVGHDSYQVVLSRNALNKANPPEVLVGELKAYNTTKTAVSYESQWPGIDQVNIILAELHQGVDSSKWENLTWLECFNSITRTENYISQRHFIMSTNYNATIDESSVTGAAVLSGVNYGTQRPVAICPDDYLLYTPGFENPGSNLIVPRTSKIKKDGKKVGHSMCWPYWNGTSSHLKKDNLNSDRFTGYKPALDIQLDYCLREKVGSQCAIYYSPLVTVILAAVTGLQALLMTIAFLACGQTPLVLPGDVIASYLKHPDVHTTSGDDTTVTEMSEQHLDTQGGGYYGAYWVITVCLVVQLVVLISWGSTVMNKPGLISAAKSPRRWLIAPVCITGAVQLVLVLREYLENVLATINQTLYEFRRFETRRAPLRVSYPLPSRSNKQEGAYILQLPVGWAIWHIGTSAFIHWWVSLYFSVQLYMVIRLDGGPDYPELSARPNGILIKCFSEVFTWFIKIFTGAFSSLPSSSSGSEFIGILFLIIVIPFTAALLVIFAGPLLIHIASVTPLMTARTLKSSDHGIGDGTDSLVISRACHPPADEGDISEKNLKWGYVEGQPGNGHDILTLSRRVVLPFKRQPTLLQNPQANIRHQAQNVDPSAMDSVSIATAHRDFVSEASVDAPRRSSTVSISTTQKAASPEPSLSEGDALRGDAMTHLVTSRTRLERHQRRDAEASALLEEGSERNEQIDEQQRDHFTEFGAYRHLF